MSVDRAAASSMKTLKKLGTEKPAATTKAAKPQKSTKTGKPKPTSTDETKYTSAKPGSAERGKAGGPAQPPANLSRAGRAQRAASKNRVSDAQLQRFAKAMTGMVDQVVDRYRKKRVPMATAQVEMQGISGLSGSFRSPDSNLTVARASGFFTVLQANPKFQAMFHKWPEDQKMKLISSVMSGGESNGPLYLMQKDARGMPEGVSKVESYRDFLSVLKTFDGQSASFLYPAP